MTRSNAPKKTGNPISNAVSKGFRLCSFQFFHINKKNAFILAYLCSWFHNLKSGLLINYLHIPEKKENVKSKKIHRVNIVKLYKYLMT